MAEIRVKSTGTIKLFENDNTSSVTIASPASLGADRTVTLPDASVTLASGTMLATDGSGASLTALNASELGSGTVPTARLGSGTASSSTVLYGDQTYKAEPGGGKILQVTQGTYSTQHNNSTTGSATATGASGTITPSATSSTILVLVDNLASCSTASGVGAMSGMVLYGDIGSAGYNLISGEGASGQNYAYGFTTSTTFTESRITNQKTFTMMWSPSTTSACTVKVYTEASVGAIASQYGASACHVVLMEIDGS